MGDERNACRILVGKPEGKRPIGRPDNIEIVVKDIGCGSVGWIDQPQDQWRALVMVLHVP
jgi:hypothetical protein